MYYTYKRVTTPGRLGTTYDFRFDPVVSDTLSADEREALYEKQKQCVYLGSYDGLRYCYVPDGYPLIEQFEQCEVSAHESLTEEESKALLEHGEYARRVLLDECSKTQRYLPSGSGLAQQQYSLDYANIMNAISSLANVVSYLLSSTYTTLSTRSSDGIDNNTIYTLNKLKDKAQALKQELNKVGL